MTEVLENGSTPSIKSQLDMKRYTFSKSHLYTRLIDANNIQLQNPDSVLARSLGTLQAINRNELTLASNSEEKSVSRSFF